MEAGVLVDIKGEPLYWHLPNDRTVVSLPDSHVLWEKFFKNREIISGFAHSHPGSGIPGPSYEDLTTFAAVEAGLGKRLNWWITSETDLIILNWAGHDRLDYHKTIMDIKPVWLNTLREYSKE